MDYCSLPSTLISLEGRTPYMNVMYEYTMMIGGAGSIIDGNKGTSMKQQEHLTLSQLKASH